jgi:hypothetical protein
MPTYTVTSVTEDQVPDASGNLTDVFDISFTVSDRPGSFQVQVAQAGDPVTEAQAAIVAKVGDVEGIYGLGS